MQSTRRSPRVTPRRLGTAATATLVMALIMSGGVAQIAVSAPADKNDKVTICHRTNAVTNPYRMITVSSNAAFTPARHPGHNESYAFGGTTYKVFTPGVDYPPSQKDWGDIIPPVRGGDGLNWNEPNAQAIYLGAGSFAGLCARMSPKQFFEVQVNALPDGLSPTDLLQAKKDILADLDEQESIDDAAIKEQLKIDKFEDLDPDNLPKAFDDLPAAPRGAKPPAGYGPEADKQKIAVYVWYDLDRDGSAEVGEPPARGVTVRLAAVVEAAPAGFAAAGTLLMAAGNYLTDNDGYIIQNLDNPGQWNVEAVPPTGNDVTYDSEGATNDAQAQVDVPAGSAGFAWVGLDPAGALTDGGGERGGELAATGASMAVTPLVFVAGALLLLAGALLGLARGARRRLGAR